MLRKAQAQNRYGISATILSLLKLLKANQMQMS